MIQFWFLYGLIGTVLRMWFRKAYVHYEEPLPDDAPIIFACTHPNSAIDYLFLPFHTRKAGSVLVRGDVFEKKSLNRIFRALWMIPVYRIRDGYSTLTKNGESFKECYDSFEKNGRVLIFSEGVCFQRKEIQPIRKGTARLALDYLKTGTNKELYIVPMTNNYTRFRQFRSTVMTHFGKPIKISDYKDYMAENENKAYLKLTEDITESLKRNFIEIKEYKDDHVIEKALTVFRFNRWEQRKAWFINDRNCFDEEKALVGKLEKLGGEALSKDWVQRFDSLPNPQLSEGILKTSARADFHFMILFSLSFFVGMASVFHYIPFKLSKWIINTKIKDIIFHDSIVIFGSGVFYLIQWIFIASILTSWLGFPGFITSLGIASLTLITVEIADDYFFAWHNLKNLKHRSKYEELYQELIAVVNR